MFAVVVVFGLPMLIAGAMIDPMDLNIGSLIEYWAIMAVFLPFVGWPIFLAQLALPTAGRSRLAAVVNVWLGGTTVAVCVIYWLYALLSYSPSGSQIELSSRVVPYEPKTGIRGRPVLPFHAHIVRILGCDSSAPAASGPFRCARQRRPVVWAPLLRRLAVIPYLIRPLTAEEDG